MDVTLLSIAVVLGISVSVLMMGILFAISSGALSVMFYVIFGLLLGTVSAGVFYGLLSSLS